MAAQEQRPAETFLVFCLLPTRLSRPVGHFRDDIGAVARQGAGKLSEVRPATSPSLRTPTEAEISFFQFFFFSLLLLFFLFRSRSRSPVRRAPGLQQR